MPELTHAISSHTDGLLRIFAGRTLMACVFPPSHYTTENGELHEMEYRTERSAMPQSAKVTGYADALRVLEAVTGYLPSLDTVAACVEMDQLAPVTQGELT